MEDKKEKLPSTRIQCDTGILWKMHSNYWRYWKNDIEIFTYFYKLKNIKINSYLWRRYLLWKNIKYYII